ncbi:hypothetical protein RJ640_012521 [Escallonia rubra]|uniref:Holocarboxylase synthetase n=1 Tax=Escallonia rubra TaxID=112253 RepID=A0AA88UD60_9ASTE|nr:hypothetical protein RJ640_012521 [Escallonia rubra]
MAKKRKSDAIRLDEVDRTMYTTFCSAANSLSQLYTQAMHQQRLSFQAGERHSLDSLYNWILRQQESGSRVTSGDITAYLETELEFGTEESPVPPRLPFQHQHTANSGIPVSSNLSGSATAGQGLRSGHSDYQSKNSSVFSNALSSPVRRSLQHYQLAQGGYYPINVMPSGNGHRTTESNVPPPQSRDTYTPSSNDSLMDMHAESPCHESSY